MSEIVVITAVGQDRPGIIAGLTEAVLALGGNLDDATMTRLHGAFAAMLSARLPTGKTEAEAHAALAPVAKRLGLSLTVQGVADSSSTPSAPDYLLTVYGADRPGIVHQVTAHLAEIGVNITDMDTRVAGAPGKPIYVMQLELASDGRDLDQEITSLRTQMALDMTLQGLETETL